MLGVRRVLMKKNGKAIEGIGSIVRYGDTSFSFFFFRGGDRACKNPGEYFVSAYWILTRNCTNTLLLHK